MIFNGGINYKVCNIGSAMQPIPGSTLFVTMSGNETILTPETTFQYKYKGWTALPGYSNESGYYTPSHYSDGSTSGSSHYGGIYFYPAI